MLNNHKKECYLMHSINSAFALRRGSSSIESWSWPLHWHESHGCQEPSFDMSTPHWFPWHCCSQEGWKLQLRHAVLQPGRDLVQRVTSWLCFSASFSVFLPQLPQTYSHPTASSPAWVIVPLPYVFFNGYISSLSFLPESEALLHLDTPTT